MRSVMPGQRVSRSNCSDAAPVLHLIVRDNGGGFDVAEASSEALQGVTFGLVGMRERVQCVGGNFELRSNGVVARKCTRGFLSMLCLRSLR